MPADAGKLLAWGRTNFDKLALFGTLCLLLVSVVWLGLRVDREQRQLAAVESAPPATAGRARPLDVSALHQALENLVTPFQVEHGQRLMMSHEPRVPCVACGRPIPLGAPQCPYRNCGAAQPVATAVKDDQDTDRDGLPDKWERQHGQDLYRDDAAADADGDGFTNLEEFRAGTDPQQPASHPPPAHKLFWVKIEKTLLPLTFQRIIRPAAGDRIFVLKDRRSGRDYYVRLGDKVAGWQVLSCDEQRKIMRQPGLPPVEQDASTLKLGRDGKLFTLTVGGGPGEGELAAELWFQVDNSSHRVVSGAVLKLQNISYKVVDIAPSGVVVSDNSTGKRFSLAKKTAADRLAPVDEGESR